jgi:dTDP-4-amino-4,6-dideoxygalactose transaminase
VIVPVDMLLTRDVSLREAMSRMNSVGLGVLLLIGVNGAFERTVTDGDLRRLILSGARLEEPLSLLPKIESFVIFAPFTRRDALAIMNRHSINHLPVLNVDRRVVEVLDRREIDEQILLSTPHMGATEMDFIEEAFRTNWIAPLGPNVDAFERDMAKVLGVDHAAALSSGTAAIHLALRLLGVGSGDFVFCSTLTFAASANPIVYQGAQPVFIDSDTESWNMSVTALEAAFACARTEGWSPKAVIIVNLYGQSADMDPLLEICVRHGVPVIEDAAESLGALYRGKASGTFGRLGVLSFNGNKIITTSGGGMLVSQDESLIQKAKFLATQARDPAPHYQHSEIGFNYRMSNILAGVGRGQLKVLGERVRARRAVFDFYQRELADTESIQWMPEPEWSYSSRWLTTCTLNPAHTKVTSSQLIQELAAEMIEARPLWKPMHLQPVFSGARFFQHGPMPVSDDLFERGVCLPSGSNMSEAALTRVVEQVRRILKRA